MILLVYKRSCDCNTTSDQYQSISAETELVKKGTLLVAHHHQSPRSRVVELISELICDLYSDKPSVQTFNSN